MTNLADPQIGEVITFACNHPDGKTALLVRYRVVDRDPAARRITVEIESAVLTEEEA